MVHKGVKKEVTDVTNDTPKCEQYEIAKGEDVDLG